MGNRPQGYDKSSEMKIFTLATVLRNTILNR